MSAAREAPSAEVVTFGPEAVPEVVALWNAAWGESFPLRESLFAQNTVMDPHFDPGGCWVARGPKRGPAVGFCLAKIAREPIGADGTLPDRGWVGALVVHPAFRRRGLGTRLLARAEAYLAGLGRRRVVLGGDPGHFFPGIPLRDEALAFFAGAGYRLRGDAFDLHRSIKGYTTPAEVATARAGHPEVDIRPLRPGEEGPLLEFMDETFPGRWRYTMGRFLAARGPVGDVMGVVRGGAVCGFAHLFHPGSRWIGPSIAWPAGVLARAAGTGTCGGLGPMGLAPAFRGRGLGLALLDAAVRHLQALGVDEMIIDWTSLIGFYGRLGFVPLRQYRHGERIL
ncbi:MAG: GNAT family N-acetyltransferase [Bacillati bacterium ANGP1]|uniref:GNAT family N-acetyltransferase n=1 Tax=Candidatus Segetimicrobium genomatis TaxID=2569760 RepID=A0A537JTY3_9BACT|nr:MAG: GNAT family N-acetyltransferase [Terrabacteria group bacterium ANGP1]